MRNDSNSNATTASSTDGDLILLDSNGTTASSADDNGDALWDATVVADYHMATATPVAEDGVEKEVQAEEHPSESSNAHQVVVGGSRGNSGRVSGSGGSSNTDVSQFDGIGKIKLLTLCRNRGLDSKPHLKDVDGLKRLLATSMANDASQVGRTMLQSKAVVAAAAEATSATKTAELSGGFSKEMLTVPAPSPPTADAGKAKQDRRRQTPTYVPVPAFSVRRKCSTPTNSIAEVGGSGDGGDGVDGSAQFDGMGKIKLLNLCRRRGLDSKPYLKDVDPKHHVDSLKHLLALHPAGGENLIAGNEDQPKSEEVVVIISSSSRDGRNEHDQSAARKATEDSDIGYEAELPPHGGVVVNYHFAAATPVSVEEVGQSNMVLNPAFSDHRGLQRSLSDDQVESTNMVLNSVHSGWMVAPQRLQSSQTAVAVNGMMLRLESDDVGGGAATVAYIEEGLTAAPVLHVEKGANHGGWNLSAVASRVKGAMAKRVGKSVSPDMLPSSAEQKTTPEQAASEGAQHQRQFKAEAEAEATAAAKVRRNLERKAAFEKEQLEQQIERDRFAEHHRAANEMVAKEEAEDTRRIEDEKKVAAESKRAAEQRYAQESADNVRLEATVTESEEIKAAKLKPQTKTGDEITEDDIGSKCKVRGKPGKGIVRFRRKLLVQDAVPEQEFVYHASQNGHVIQGLEFFCPSTADETTYGIYIAKVSEPMGTVAPNVVKPVVETRSLSSASAAAAVPAPTVVTAVCRHHSTASKTARPGCKVISINTTDVSKYTKLQFDDCVKTEFAKLNGIAAQKATIVLKLKFDPKGFKVYDEGTLYNSEMESNSKVFVGIAMDKEKVEQHDGTVLGKRYFECNQGHGVLVESHMVTVTTKEGLLVEKDKKEKEEAAKNKKEKEELHKRQVDAAAEAKRLKEAAIVKQKKEEEQRAVAAKTIQDAVDHQKKAAQEERAKHDHLVPADILDSIKECDKKDVVESEAARAKRDCKDRILKAKKLAQAEQDVKTFPPWVRHFLPGILTKKVDLKPKPETVHWAPPLPPSWRDSQQALNEPMLNRNASDDVCDTELDMAEQARDWLADHFEHIYLDEEELKEHPKECTCGRCECNRWRKLFLSSKNIVDTFTSLGQFAHLQKLLKKASATLGETLNASHRANYLSELLSESRLSNADDGTRFYRWHALVPKDRDKLSNCDVFPGLRDGKGILNYSSCYQIEEMAALQVTLITAKLVNTRFQDAVKKVAEPFAVMEKSNFTSDSKGFARANDKGESVKDYRYDKVPRAASNVKDGVRNIVVVKSVANLLGFVHALSKRFKGLGKLKNPFGESVEKQAEKDHCLPMNITVIFEAGPTFSDLLEEPKSKDLLEKYAKTIDCKSKERWGQSVKKALAFMQKLGQTPVIVLGEVQVLFEIDCDIRKITHGMYDVQRAKDMHVLFSPEDKRELEALGYLAKDASKEQAMRTCAMDGDARKMEQLIATEGSDVNKDYSWKGSNVPLMIIAAGENNPEVLNVLLKYGCRIDAISDRGTPLAVASYAGATNAVKFLIAQRANINMCSRTSFATASHADNAELTLTPLMSACLGGFRDTVKCLIEARADVNARNKIRCTALHFASKDAVIVNELVRYGAQQNVPDQFGATPLHQAACRGDAEIIDALLKNGALVDTPTHDTHSRMTPAELCCYVLQTQKQIDCLEILAEGGAVKAEGGAVKADLQFLSKHGTALGILQERSDIGIQMKNVAIDKVTKLLTRRRGAGSLRRAEAEKDSIEKNSDVENEADEFLAYLKDQLSAKAVLAEDGSPLPRAGSSLPAAPEDEAQFATVALAIRENLKGLNVNTLDDLKTWCRTKDVERIAAVQHAVDCAMTDTEVLYRDRILDIFRMNMSAKVYKEKLESSAAKHLDKPQTASSWLSGRHGFFEKRDIKKRRKETNDEVKRVKAKQSNVLKKARAAAVSQDKVINTNVKAELHRDALTSDDPNVRDLPGTPDIPDESDIREMLKNEIQARYDPSCCDTEIPHTQYAVAAETIFDKIDVGVFWRYTLQTTYHIRYLQQQLTRSGQYFEQYGRGHIRNFFDIDWYDLPSLWDYSRQELKTNDELGTPLQGSVFEEICRLCDGDGKLLCGRCSGHGQVECFKCDEFGNEHEEVERQNEYTGNFEYIDHASTCRTCDGRKVYDCPICLGDGWLTCHDCDGDRSFIGWLSMHVAERQHTLTGCPGEQIGGVKTEQKTRTTVELVEGGKASDFSSRYIDHIDPVNPVKNPNGAGIYFSGDEQLYDPDEPDAGTNGPAYDPYHIERLAPVDTVSEALSDTSTELIEEAKSTLI